MSRFACVLGAVGCCLLLATCGTGRALIGDYADDFSIRNIRPTASVSGAEAVFEADVCTKDGLVINTDDPPSYTWDFGGGCEPNVSFEEMPEVVIRDGLRAPYNCKLTLAGGCLEDDVVTATFTLQVTPLSVLAVAPTTGVGNATATFSAIVGSGNVTDYVWDFGGACNPNGSNFSHPAVSFINSAGIYQARVIVSNDFEVLEFPFVITVAESVEEPPAA